MVGGEAAVARVSGVTGEETALYEDAAQSCLSLRGTCRTRASPNLGPPRCDASPRINRATGVQKSCSQKRLLVFLPCSGARTHKMPTGTKGRAEADRAAVLWATSRQP